MVKQLSANDSTLRLLLTPNHSMSWHGNVRVLLAICAVSLLIVVGMVWAGAWVVLPFAGLELTALAAALYWTARNGQRQEVLVVTADRLRLEKGLYRKHAEWELPRDYTRVRLTEPRHPWTPPKLYLQHRDTEIELAHFLNLNDTQRLLQSLERLGLRIERRLAEAEPLF